MKNIVPIKPYKDTPDSRPETKPRKHLDIFMKSYFKSKLNPTTIDSFIKST